MADVEEGTQGPGHECDVSSGTWECVSNRQVSDDGAGSLYGHWVSRGYLSEG